MVYAPIVAAVLGTYLTLIPVKEGLAPVPSVMAKVSVGSFDSGPRGSLRTLIVSSPVLVIVATTLRLSTVLTCSGPRINVILVFTIR